MNCRRLFLLVILSLSGTILLSSAAMSVAQTSSTKAKTAAKSKAAKKRGSKSVASKRKKKMTPRVRRIRRAFVASSSLRPMARQLLQDRTPAGYAGVEAYARRHSKEDAGSLAWLVVGYAHIVDHDYVKAIDPLNRAKLHAGDLSEYVNYYLGTAYMQAGRSAECIATLSSFARDFPDSILLRDAHVVYANALMQEGRPQDAATLLEGDRQPARVDVEWNLGRAYEAAGNLPKAASIFRNIYLTMPLTGEAELANSELKKLAGSTTVQPANVDERKTRADLLLKGRRYADAAEEYKDLLEQVSPDDRAGTQLSLATALLKSGHGKDAKKILDSLAPSSADTNAQKLYLLGEVARGSDNDDEFLKDLDQLRQQAPTSPWLEQGLLSAGNVFLLRKDYDRAIDAYRELQQRFPNAGRAPYAHWKAAWLTLRQGRKAEAEKEFEEQIGLYPSSNEVPAALYWRARLAEEDGETAKARAFYQKLSDRFRNYYYADLARKQLKVLKSTGEPISYALLDKVAPIDAKADIVADDPPSDNLRVQKAELLGNGGLVDLAARELQAASNEEKGDWVAPETARLFQENELYNRGIEIMKRAVPNYFAMDIPALPRSYWEALFPRPYWADLKRYSTQNELDPFLVASLIRQESEFNAGAVSHKNAVGLMQLLPGTGKKVAKEEKLRHFSANQLFTPGVNLQLGTRYFRTMVDKFGSFEYALAAYNAGSDRVEDWLSAGNYRDPQEFVESIPFTETREYVQAILRNASVYRQLYGTP
ncbi:MAG TPA: transglycosylase SLT domain-containing protein [Terriglobales bacterium]|nr:transglycosylase SLT domain-containing protein [Terriglobales bacterium]